MNTVTRMGVRSREVGVRSYDGTIFMPSSIVGKKLIAHRESSADDNRGNAMDCECGPGSILESLETYVYGNTDVSLIDGGICSITCDGIHPTDRVKSRHSGKNRGIGLHNRSSIVVNSVYEIGMRSRFRKALKDAFCRIGAKRYRRIDRVVGNDRFYQYLFNNSYHESVWRSRAEGFNDIFGRDVVSDYIFLKSSELNYEKTYVSYLHSFLDHDCLDLDEVETNKVESMGEGIGIYDIRQYLTPTSYLGNIRFRNGKFLEKTESGSIEGMEEFSYKREFLLEYNRTGKSAISLKELRNRCKPVEFVKKSVDDKRYASCSDLSSLYVSRVGKIRIKDLSKWAYNREFSIGDDIPIFKEISNSGDEIVYFKHDPFVGKNDDKEVLYVGDEFAIIEQYVFDNVVIDRFNVQYGDRGYYYATKSMDYLGMKILKTDGMIGWIFVQFAKDKPFVKIGRKRQPKKRMERSIVQNEYSLDDYYEQLQDRMESIRTR